MQYLVTGVVAAACLAAAVWIIVTYNRLVKMRAQVRNMWAQVGVELKRRYDLVPILAQTVKGYAKHEKATFEKVAMARAAMDESHTPKEMAAANNMLTSSLRTVIAVAEDYPKLRADKNFLRLQKELVEIESKIAFARQFYNDEAFKLNRETQQVPANIVAGIFGFTQVDYFKATAAETKALKVKF